MAHPNITLRCAHFIGGQYLEAPEAIEVMSPSTGQRVGGIPCADADIVHAAVGAARTALETSNWGSVSPRERLRALHSWAGLIEAEAETLAQLEAICSTRPLGQVRSGDVMVTAEQIRFFAEFADKEGGTLAPTADGAFGFIEDAPYGVVGAIAPWNYPISMAGWKLGPALAAGNAVVLKPSEKTPWSTLYLAELSVRAGLPAGLVNIVLGDGPVTGAALVAHPDVAKVSFTGSTRAGGAIMENIARTGIKPMTLELGGKSPMLVFEDADLDLATDALVRGILPNAGQFCVAGSRILVHESIAEALAARLVERFAQPAPRDTMDAEDGFSPIISERQMRRIDSIVPGGARAGGRAADRGRELRSRGDVLSPDLAGRGDAGQPRRDRRDLWPRRHIPDLHRRG